MEQATADSRIAKEDLPTAAAKLEEAEGQLRQARERLEAGQREVGDIGMHLGSLENVNNLSDLRASQQMYEEPAISGDAALLEPWPAGLAGGTQRDPLQRTASAQVREQLSPHCSGDYTQQGRQRICTVSRTDAVALLMYQQCEAGRGEHCQQNLWCANLALPMYRYS